MSDNRTNHGAKAIDVVTKASGQLEKVQKQLQYSLAKPEYVSAATIGHLVIARRLLKEARKVVTRALKEEIKNQEAVA